MLLLGLLQLLVTVATLVVIVDVIVQMNCWMVLGVWPRGWVGWLVNHLVVINNGGLMSNLNIAKMVCEREGSHSMKTYKRAEDGSAIMKQCSRCGKIIHIGG